MKYTQFILFNPKSSEDPFLTNLQNQITPELSKTNQLLDQNLIPEALTKYQEFQKQISITKEPFLYRYLSYQQGICYKISARQKNIVDNLLQSVFAFKKALQINRDERESDIPAMFQLRACAYNELGSGLISLAHYRDKDENQRQGIDALNETLQLLEKKLHSSEKLTGPFPQIDIHLTNTHLLLSEFTSAQEHLEQAITLCLEALQFLSVDQTSSSYALVQYNLGFAYQAISNYRDQDRNQQQAIAAFEEALKIYQGPGFPFEYAHTQNCLAGLYIDRAQAQDSEENLKNAMNACKDLLNIVPSIEEYPFGHGTILNNLASACKIYSQTRNKLSYLEKAEYYLKQILEIEALSEYSEVVASTRLNLGLIHRQLADSHPDRVHLAEAINWMTEALQIYTSKDFPFYYGMTQNYLGKAYQAMRHFDPNDDENLSKAIHAFQEALVIFTPAEYPEDHTQIQIELADTLLASTKTDCQEDLLTSAIENYQEALKVCSSETNPEGFAKISSNLGESYQRLAESKKEDQLYALAIQSFEKVLTVYPSGDFPEKHGIILDKLGQIYCSYSKINNQSNNVNKAIELFKEALTLCSHEKYPDEYATINKNLGFAYLDMAEVGEQNYHLNQAAEVFKESLRYYTKDQFPGEFATIMNHIGSVYKTMAEVSDRSDFKNAEKLKEYKLDRIKEALESYRDALDVFTADTHPLECAKIHFEMGEAFNMMIPIHNKTEAVFNAIQSFREALKIYDPEKYPEQNKQVSMQLEMLRQMI